MGWWSRRRAHGSGQGSATGSAGRSQGDVDVNAVHDYLEGFVAARRGVEAYVEPPTNVSAPTVVLIAHDGEWTRRAIPSRDAGFELGRALAIPVYDVNQTGYPSRMREWNSRQRQRQRGRGR